jgi:UDP-2,4-diacetamido-2,4,6-trideoxy-beta-L-altropyranose hydrolase
MNIAFRSDASRDIGTGHVMRCLTLADALHERGAQSTFLYRPHAGHLLDLISKRGHKAIALGPADESFTFAEDSPHSKWLGSDWVTDAEQTRQALGGKKLDWLVVDHYSLDNRWEKALRPNTRRILTIDDLADRPHDCDLLLDQNLGRQTLDYVGLISSHTQTLIGPKYALLQPEFARCRKHSLERRVLPQFKNILVTMGGVDQANATAQVLNALRSCELPADLCINVVMGPSTPWLAQVQAQASGMPRPTQVFSGINNMAQLMAESDLCIGAAGSTSWERCCLGLPAIQLVLAANQKEINEALELAGSVMSLHLEKLNAELPSLIAKVSCTDALRELSKSSASICDGMGVAKTVQLLEKVINEDHPALQ